MVFKLVRTDTEYPCKIQLPVGKHLIGRGKFLDCDDKRVSRKHGELEVTADAISIKALHQNPCFYRRKGTEDIEVVPQHCIVNLSHGDKFGLLPSVFWYEVVHCALLDNVQCPVIESTQRLEESLTATEPFNNDLDNTTEDEQLLNVDLNAASQKQSPPLPPNVEVKRETLENNTEAPFVFCDRAGSPSLTQNESQSLLEEAGSPSILPPNAPSENHTQNEEDQSPPKRAHSPVDTQDGAKKIKTEPPDIQVEAQDIKPEPGVVKDEPSTANAQPGPSSDPGSANGPAGSPAKPPAPARERCIYGASCYRKNPLHKAQFAHPSDGDWGGGARGRCPYGRGCRRRDPRHWAAHDHPPGLRPPPDRPGAQVVERRGNIFYINAHTVNFYDDHFQVEDSDGDSVDYDYEF